MPFSACYVNETLVSNSLARARCHSRVHELGELRLVADEVFTPMEVLRLRCFSTE